MKVTAIIAEYNPFHNGHLYHLNTARSLTDSEYSIVLMSGNYTQRGYPAIMDKYRRAQMALTCGADLVLELPLPYAAGSAEYFATGALALLDRLGVVDSLCFGSECGSITPLQELAMLLNEEPEDYTQALRNRLKAGLSFPVARSQALASSCTGSELSCDLINSPNNILGIEYIRALLRENSSILPVTVKRAGSGYNDSILSGSHSSALAIRTSLFDTASLTSTRNQVPEPVFRQMEACFNQCFPISPDDFSLLLQYSLLQADGASLAHYWDVTPELSNRIHNLLPDYTSFTAFCGALKTKDLTYTRISRSLLHILLGITDSLMERYARTGHAPYARILGFRKSAGPLLSSIKRNTSVPCITKLADASSYLPPENYSLLQKEITASHIYESVISHKFHSSPKQECSRQILLL